MEHILDKRTRALCVFVIGMTLACLALAWNYPISSGSHRKTAPTISGNPAAALLVDEQYSFQPSVNVSSKPIRFSIANQPAWLNFSADNGLLAGKPSAAQVGSYDQIIITVTDGRGAKASLGPFSISVGAVPSQKVVSGDATVSWVPPSLNEDGSKLSDLAGFRIYYGTDSSSLTNVVPVGDVAATEYTVSGLGAGTYFFAVTAIAADGAESAQSPVASKTIG